MTQAIYVSLTVLIGSLAAVQTSMLASMGLARNPFAAAWVSIFATILGFSLILTYRAATTTTGLPSPFHIPLGPAIVAALAALSLVASIQGLPPYFALTGLLAIPFLFGAGFLAPRLGVGLFLSAIIAGQLTGALIVDHIGAFGVPIHRIDLIRILGLGTLIAGVVLIRGFR